MEKYYITTPIYYINDKPHIGHTYTTVAADVLARYQRFLGKDVFFLTGADENAQKTVAAAEAKNQDIQTYTDEMSALWKKTWEDLGITYNDFIRTTSENHKKGVYKFFDQVKKKGDIYKGLYKGLYCVGCEAFLTEKDLVAGLCPAHKKKPELISEENYFFRLANYRVALLEHYKKYPKFIQPESRKNEVINYVRDHLADISISRQSLKWGIPFPLNRSHKFYVWFDALLNYLTGIGFGWDEDKFKRYWPADLHIIGKDIIKFHCAIWPAMLMSAGIALPKKVFAHGFFTLNGEKISKSLGNIIDPFSLKRKYGFEAVRYFLFAEIPFGGDGDFSEKRLVQRYNGDLANGLGNLVARIAKLCEISGAEFPQRREKLEFSSGYGEYFEEFRFNEMLQDLWDSLSRLDREINKRKIWELKGDKLTAAIKPLVGSMRKIAYHLQPFMPETAEKILKRYRGPVIRSKESIFPRIKFV